MLEFNTVRLIVGRDHLRLPDRVASEILPDEIVGTAAVAKSPQPASGA